MKEYLGDGAYVDFDGFSLILTAENGIEATDTIYLEPSVWVTLVSYVERIRQTEKEKTDGPRDSSPTGS